MRERFGGSRVRDELYQWFVADAKTISYVHAGILRLFTKPENEAMAILTNATRRLSGMPAMEWREFVKHGSDQERERKTL